MVGDPEEMRFEQSRVSDSVSLPIGRCSKSSSPPPAPAVKLAVSRTLAQRHGISLAEKGFEGQAGQEMNEMKLRVPSLDPRRQKAIRLFCHPTASFESMI